MMAQIPITRPMIPPTYTVDTLQPFKNHRKHRPQRKPFQGGAFKEHILYESIPVPVFSAIMNNLSRILTEAAALQWDGQTNKSPSTTAKISFVSLLFYVIETSKVISGRVPTCDSAHSSRLYSAAPL